MKINPVGKRDLARERQFVKLWNAGTPIPEIMRLMDYTAEDSVHCRAQHLRAKGYSLRMGRFRRRTVPRHPRNYPGDDLDRQYGPPCVLYDAAGQAIGTMDPTTRERQYTVCATCHGTGEVPARLDGRRIWRCPDCLGRPADE